MTTTSNVALGKRKDTDRAEVDSPGKRLKMTNPPQETWSWTLRNMVKVGCENSWRVYNAAKLFWTRDPKGLFEGYFIPNTSFTTVPVGPMTWHGTSDPALMDAILSHHRNDNEGPFSFDETNNTVFAFLKEFFPEAGLNDFLLTADKPTHEKLRALIEPELKQSVIEEKYRHVLAETVTEAITEWSKLPMPFDLKDVTSLLTCTAISRTLLGYTGSYQELAEAMNLVNEVFVNLLCKKTTDPSRLSASRSVIDGAITDTLENSQTAFVKSVRESDITEEQKRKILFNLFFGGQETSASMLDYIILTLAQRPDLQEEIFQQISKNSSLSLEELVQACPLVKQIITEALRLFPPAYALSRQSPHHAELRYTEKDGSEAIAHTKPNEFIAACVFAAAKDPAKYKDPQDFDPHRHKESCPMPWMPFGKGPDSCVGRWFAWEELRLAIIYCVQNYNLSTTVKGPIPTKGMLTMRVACPALITMTPRVKSPERL